MTQSTATYFRTKKTVNTAGLTKANISNGSYQRGESEIGVYWSCKKEAFLVFGKEDVCVCERSVFAFQESYHQGMADR